MYLRLMFLLCIATWSTTALAVQQENGQYTWEFASGKAWPGGYNQNTGKPEGLTWARNEYPNDFFRRINNALPEQQINEAFLTDDSGSNITLQEEAEVFVTFLHEGAGYKNSFGYFTFDKDNPPTDISQIQETIIFPNLSYPHLANGHRVSLGTFPAGTSIGFFIAANGFWYYTGVKPWQIPYYYSIQDLNPEAAPELRQHNVLLYDDEVKEVIIGFEDLPRTWGDNDFNDAVFSVKTSPPTAIDNTDLVTIPDANDSDADGIPDGEDEFPNNYRRSHSSHFPAATDWSTLAYEDTWPRLGDYDMNDLVVRSRSQLYFDANNQVTGFKISGFIDARGAAFSNGFGVRLRGVSEQYFEEATITIAGNVYPKLAESGQSDIVIQLWANTHDYTTTGKSGKCSHFNTVKACGYLPAVPFELEVDLTEGITMQHDAFDYFLFRTNYRGREIHFADVPPTDKFDLTQFGKFADDSDPTAQRFFKTEANLPWALKIDTQWRYPQEYIDVNWAYPKFQDWIESNGQDAKNWYKENGRIHHYY
ncbi:MAG: LruC domain-containing protein [Pseudomonadota bacterium]